MFPHFLAGYPFNCPRDQYVVLSPAGGAAPGQENDQEEIRMNGIHVTNVLSYTTEDLRNNLDNGISSISKLFG
jgi:hypothetical protein